MELWGFGVMLGLVGLVFVVVRQMGGAGRTAPNRRTGRPAHRDASDGAAVMGATDDHDHRHHDSRTPDAADSSSADSGTSDSGSSGSDGGGGGE